MDQALISISTIQKFPGQVTINMYRTFFCGTHFLCFPKPGFFSYPITISSGLRFLWCFIINLFWQSQKYFKGLSPTSPRTLYLVTICLFNQFIYLQELFNAIFLSVFGDSNERGKATISHIHFPFHATCYISCLPANHEPQSFGLICHNIFVLRF